MNCMIKLRKELFAYVQNGFKKWIEMLGGPTKHKN